ncbi:MAG: TetR/AcrR family transcriptional regulator, partial [Actinomycetes bacterium]
EHLAANHLHRTHAPLMSTLQALVERGQRDGVFRTDLPPAWLVTAYFSLVHGADDHARVHGLGRDEAQEMLATTVRDVFAARAS